MKEFKGQSIADEGVLKGIADRCRQDAQFRATLRQNPEAVLEGMGIVIPGGIQLEVKGDTAETERLCITAPEELTDEEIMKVTGGFSTLFKPSLQGVQTSPLQGARLPRVIMLPLYGI